MSEATEIASMGITSMVELMQARNEIKRLKEALAKQEQRSDSEHLDEPAPVAKNENGSIKWLIDDWPQNCLLYTHTTPQPVTESHKRNPLTVQQIDDLWATWSFPINNVSQAILFARQIEFAHDIKGKDDAV